MLSCWVMKGLWRLGAWGHILGALYSALPRTKPDDYHQLVMWGWGEKDIKFKTFITRAWAAKCFWMRLCLCFLAQVSGPVAVSKCLGEYELKRSRLVTSLLVYCMRRCRSILIFMASTVFILWINLFLFLRWIEWIRGHLLNGESKSDWSVFLSPVKTRRASGSWSEHSYMLHTHDSLLVSHFSSWNMGLHHVNRWVSQQCQIFTSCL